MCPLRFILVFFSAVLAAYFAWKTVSPAITAEDDNKDHEKRHDQYHFSKMEMVQDSFWVLVDMASGRYLWRNIKQLSHAQQPMIATN